jgi:hypothetical protein
MNQKEEKFLRSNIRHMIRHVKQKKLNEEDKLRDIIRGFMSHELESLLKESSLPDVDPVPNKSTGINVLEELLKKVIPVLEVDYKSLTTNDQQRRSFRAHIINAVVNTLTPAKVNTAAGDDEDVEALQELGMEEETDIIVGDDADAVDDKFIDIRSDSDRASEEGEVEEDPRADFGSGVEGDLTGRNVAYQSFKKVESSIIDSYELLSDPEDQELFYDYLIANLKLYFDKFEGELSSAVEEPTNQAYDMAKSDVGSDVGGGEDLELEL